MEGGGGVPQDFGYDQQDTIRIWFSGQDHSPPAGGEEIFGIWASFCEGKTVFERHEKANFPSATHPMTLLANAVHRISLCSFTRCKRKFLKIHGFAKGKHCIKAFIWPAAGAEKFGPFWDQNRVPPMEGGEGGPSGFWIRSEETISSPPLVTPYACVCVCVCVCGVCVCVCVCVCVRGGGGGLDGHGIKKGNTNAGRLATTKPLESKREAWKHAKI